MTVFIRVNGLGGHVLQTRISHTPRIPGLQIEKRISWFVTCSAGSGDSDSSTAQVEISGLLV